MFRIIVHTNLVQHCMQQNILHYSTDITKNVLFVRHVKCLSTVTKRGFTVNSFITAHMQQMKEFHFRINCTLNLGECNLLRIHCMKNTIIFITITNKGHCWHCQTSIQLTLTIIIITFWFFIFN